MSYNFCTSGAIKDKAGLNANSAVIASNAIMARWCDFAEAVVCANSKYNFIAASSSIITGIKEVISDTVSSIAAMQIINYDMSGYTSRSEAQTMLDVHRDIIDRNLAILKNINIKDFLI